MTYALLGAVGLFIAGPIAIVWAQQAEKEVAISVKDLPQAIQKALGDVEVDEVEQVTVGDRLIYEITIEEDDVEFEMALDREGRLLGIEVESEDDEDDQDEDDDDEDEDDGEDDDDEDDDDEDEEDDD